MPIGEHQARHFTGLIPEETRLWREWLIRHEGEFESFEYNVHVGKGLTFPSRSLIGDDELDAKMREKYRRDTQKKIDVVGRQGPAWWIFEVEERAGTRALGQLLTYENLLPKSRPIEGPIRLSLVTDRVGPDMLDTFKRNRVVVFQVGRAR